MQIQVALIFAIVASALASDAYLGGYKDNRAREAAVHAYNAKRQAQVNLLAEKAGASSGTFRQVGVPGTGLEGKGYAYGYPTGYGYKKPAATYEYKPAAYDYKPATYEKPAVHEYKPVAYEKPAVQEYKPVAYEQPAVHEYKPVAYEQPAVHEYKPAAYDYKPVANYGHDYSKQTYNGFAKY